MLHPGGTGISSRFAEMLLERYGEGDGLPALVLGRSVPEEEIGRGGTGAVYRPRERGSGRRLALKVFLWGPLGSARELCRFELEARATAALEHPAIVPVCETGSAHGYPFRALKPLAGGSLQDRRASFRGRYQEITRPPRAASEATLRRRCRVRTLAFSPDGSRLLVAGPRGTVPFWRTLLSAGGKRAYRGGIIIGRAAPASEKWEAHR